jgi:hypothetical protein
MDKLSLYQLEELAQHERGHRKDNEFYIAYLWYLMQDLDSEFEIELKRDYTAYKATIKETA